MVVEQHRATFVAAYQLMPPDETNLTATVFRHMECNNLTLLEFVIYLRSDEHWMLIGCTLSILVLLGVLLNIIVAYVFTRPSMRQMLNLVLATLSVSDTLYLCMLFLNLSTNVFYRRVNEIDPIPTALVIVRFASYPFMHIFYTTSLWLVLCASVERNWAICYPLHHPVLPSTRRAIYVALGIVILAVMINIPAFLEFKLMKLEDRTDPDADRYLIAESEYREFTNTYNFVVRGLLHFIGPLVSIGALNARTMMVIRRAQSHTQDLTPSRRSEMRSGAMMLAYALFFVLCHVLPTTHYMLQTFWKDWYLCQHAKVFLVLRDMAAVLLALNTSASFPIYFVYGSKFRNVCIQVIIPRKTYTRLSVKHARFIGASNLSLVGLGLELRPPTRSGSNMRTPTSACGGATGSRSNLSACGPSTSAADR